MIGFIQTAEIHISSEEIRELINTAAEVGGHLRGLLTLVSCDGAKRLGSFVSCATIQVLHRLRGIIDVLIFTSDSWSGNSLDSLCNGGYEGDGNELLHILLWLKFFCFINWTRLHP